MSIATFDEVATRFLKETGCKVMALKGAWGVGKTYAWHRVAAKSAEGIWPPTYSYVSLFGLSSLTDIRMAILANARPAELVGKPMTAEAVNEHWLRFALTKGSWLLQRLRKGEGPLKHINVALDILAPSFVKDMVICFDDFERINSERVSHEELMGLISTLKETAGCKVVIILNDEQLPVAETTGEKLPAEEAAGEKRPNKESAYTKYREKVVDLEFRFNPSGAEAIEWGLPTDLPCRDVARETALKLGVVNVRVLKKIADAITLLIPLAGSRAEVQQEAVKSAVLIGWCYFDRSGRAPSVEFVRSWNAMLLAIEKKEGKRSPEEVRWAELMNEWKFGRFDEFDAAVLKVIEQGYIEESGFLEEVAKREIAYNAGDLESEVRIAWDLYQDSFENNDAQVVDTLDATFRKAVKIVTPSDLNSCVVLMRKLGESKRANDLLSYYIDVRGDEPALFDPRRNAFSEYVTDPAVRAAFEAQHEAQQQKVPLRQAVETIAAGGGYSPEHELALAEASVDDFYNLFKGPLSIRRSSAIRTCLQFASPGLGNKVIAERARQALERIAAESEINAIRLAPYGVTAAGTDEIPKDQAGTAEPA